MKKTIPFKKQLQFKTNVAEIISISLENTLHTNEQSIEGELIINGTYKITETSTETECFEFQIPINIDIDNKYLTENIIIDINDFYYELINNSILEVNIEILLDNINEKPIIEEPQIEEIKQEPIKKEKEKMRDEKPETRCIEEEQEDQIIQQEQKKQETIQNLNIFENMTEEKEPYSTYHIYIVREGDNIETIMAKYNVTRENLSEYNDLTELKLGDKIIIPELNARN